jgi:NAD(P)H-dependent FMN reductase
MRLGIIIGSHRSNSQSTKVGSYINSSINRLNSSADVYTIDLANNPFPLWDETKWQPESELSKHWAPYSEELKKCSGFIVISPEWSGMATPALKNFFLFCGANELSHKPALIITVSAGRGGSYPVAELRMSSFKNTAIVYLPEHVIVQSVDSVLNDDKINEADKADTYIKRRIDYALSILFQYSVALTQVRESNVLDFKTYPYGM